MSQCFGYRCLTKVKLVAKDYEIHGHANMLKLIDSESAVVVSGSSEC